MIRAWASATGSSPANAAALSRSGKRKSGISLIFPTFWAQAGQWKDGYEVAIRAATPAQRPTGAPIAATLLTRKNLGTYGSGAIEVTVRLARPEDTARLKSWLGGKVVRVFR